MLVGFLYNGEGLLMGVKCTCPICKKHLKISKVNLTKTSYGYSSKIDITCTCGYTANFVEKNINKIPSDSVFKRTCKECGFIWNFNIDDVKVEQYKEIKVLGKSLITMSGNMLAGMVPGEKIDDLNRCSKCGSRKVNINLTAADKFTEKINDLEKAIAETKLKNEQRREEFKKKREDSKQKIEDLKQKYEEQKQKGNLKLEEAKARTTETIRKRKEGELPWQIKKAQKKAKKSTN